MFILVLNAGSSSLKFQIFKKSGSKLAPIIKGEVEAINLANSSITINHVTTKTTVKSHQEALQKSFQLILKTGLIKDLQEIKLIGHRVVHGGEKYRKSVRINATVIKEIKNLSKLAPLHNPANLAGIISCQKLLPKAAQVAVFDTAFHQTIPEKAFLYALPAEFHKKHKIRRYGFHGINHQYVSEEAIKILKAKKKPFKRILSCHLGNGCSITAILDGKSIETSMGFTPLEGLIMGTRSGDIDPAIPLYMEKTLNQSPAEIDQLLNKKSGLLGLTGLSSDMRTIHAAAQKGNKKAILALEMYTYRIAKYIGSFIGVLGGVDAIIMTAGIGEHAGYVRQAIFDYFKGTLDLNPKANLNNEQFINSAKSKTQILIIPANEELKIAQESLKLVS